ncbi:MAG TPA: hypothetical protein VFA67_01855 [Candidatus Sulfotelmatobacter sp.]|nr:hypothetical protein [Candidatus Sulfotelmatobacter sp.]
MQSGSKNSLDITRLKNDVAAASIELLSAHCATDRIRLRYSLPDIAQFGERSDLRKAIASAGALCRFFSQLEAHVQRREER